MRTQFTGSQESVVNMDMEVPIIGGGLTGRAAPRTSAPASVSASNSPVPGAGGAPAAAQSSPPRAVRALPSCCFVSFRSSRAFYVFLCRFGGGPTPSPPPSPVRALPSFFFFLPSFCSAAPALVGVSVAWPSLIVCFCQFAVGGGRSGRRGAFGAAPLVVAAVAGAQHVGRHSKPSRHRLQPTGSHT